jgi:hypothetical protein
LPRPNNRNDHEDKEEQPTTMFSTPEHLEVLFKMNRPNFTELVVALKGGSSNGVGFKLSLGILVGSKITRW